MFNQPKLNTMETIELYESPQLEANQDKYGMEGCVCCGKPLKNENLWVHMNTDWKAVRVDISEENCEAETGAESQGCFPIGSDCAKKMPKNFVLKM